MPYPHPSTQESFEHYRGLQESSRYLPIDQLEDGCIYLIHARNSYIGIWRASERGFTLVREKFGRRFLFTEFHWDTGVPFGTVKPFLGTHGAGPALGGFSSLYRKNLKVNSMRRWLRLTSHFDM